MMTSSQLQNKVAIVTGATSGIGNAIAIMFASRGAKVTLCGRDEDRLKSVFDRAVQASGGHSDRFLMIRGDVNLQDVRRQIVAKTVEKFGSLDILVANAGIVVPNCDIPSAVEESYDKIMNTNVKSVYFLIQQAAPHLEKSKGNIVCVSSVLSTLVCSQNSMYPISKAAVDHLVSSFAVDLGPKGVRINSVNPSMIPTPLLRGCFGDDTDKIMAVWYANEREKQPLEHRLGTSEEVAEAVAFLASDAARFITGQHIKVDGGRSLQGAFDPPALQ